MIYAQRFIELHEGKFPADKEYLTFQFKHGETILNNYKEVINEKIEFQRNKKISEVTVISTMIMVTAAFIGITLSMGAPNIASHKLGLFDQPMFITMSGLSVYMLLLLLLLRNAFKE